MNGGVLRDSVNLWEMFRPFVSSVSVFRHLLKIIQEKNGFVRLVMVIWHHCTLDRLVYCMN